MAQNESVDVVLVGAGIMSATLAVLLKELDPSIKLEVVEAMDSGAAESSNPWNNAGTGHAGLCELNYTPQAADGSIDIKKAVHINTQFEVSRQFWAYLVRKGSFGSPRAFINPVPHLSYVEGDKGVSFLKKRFELLKQHHAFGEMELAVRASEALLAEAGRAVDRADADLSAATVGAASLAVAAARASSTQASLEVGTRVFEVAGTRSALDSLDLHHLESLREDQ